MGFWSTITGAGSIDKTMDIAGKMTDGMISGLDKMAFTEEEKEETLSKRIEMFIKIGEANLEFVKATASETTTRSVTRRIVAIFIMSITAITYFSIAVIYKFDPGWAEFLLKLASAFYIGVAFLSVVIFFFGNHVINGVISKIKK